MADQQKRGAVLITGTSTGIGRTTALYLDKLGFEVFAAVRKERDGLPIMAAGDLFHGTERPVKDRL